VDRCRKVCFLTGANDNLFLPSFPVKIFTCVSSVKIARDLSRFADDVWARGERIERCARRD
jgi:hypothetical protein